MAKATDIAADEAVKHFKDITVNVPKLDRTGKPVRDPETKRIVTEDKPLAADHVLAARDLGDSVAITTVDGRKHQTQKKSGK